MSQFYSEYSKCFILPFFFNFDIILLQCVGVGQQPIPLEGQTLSDFHTLATTIFNLSSETHEAKRLLHLFNLNFYKVSIQTTTSEYIYLGFHLLFSCLIFRQLLTFPLILQCGLILMQPLPYPLSTIIFQDLSIFKILMSKCLRVLAMYTIA